MSISSFLQSVFGFRTVPTTVFLILIYAAAFVSLYVTGQLPAVPAVDKQHGYGVDLEAAYKDLHLVRGIMLLGSTDTNFTLFAHASINRSLLVHTRTIRMRTTALENTYLIASHRSRKDMILFMFLMT